MVVRDTNVIVKATPLYPDIMAPNAESLLIQKFEELKKLQKEISEASMQLTTTRQRFTKLQELFNSQASLFDIQYGSKEINEIKGTTNLVLINPEDYRNK